MAQDASPDIALPPSRSWRLGDLAAIAFAVLSLTFGAIFAITVPKLWGPDEGSQFSRAYQVAHLGFLPERISQVADVYGGEIPRTVLPVMSLVSSHQWSAPERGPVYVAGDSHRRAESASIRAPLVRHAFTNTAAYAPVAYAPAAIGLRLAELLDASVGQAIVFMRLAGVLVYTWVVAAALFALRQSTFVWVIFAVGALPAAVFQASVISADSVTNCVSVFFVALVAKGAFLRRQLRPWESYGLVVGALLLSAVKPTYVLLVPLLFLLPPEQLRFGPRHRSPDARVSSRRRFAVLGAVGVTSAASLVLAALWAGLVSGAFVARADGQNRPVGRAAHQLGFVVGHPVEMTRIFARTLGDLGWRYFLEFFSQMGYHVQGSTTSVGLCIVAFGLALGITERGRLSSWRLATMLLVLLLSVLAIFTTLYLTFTLVGYYQIRGVQGRYFIPLAVLAALAVSAASPFRLATAEGGVERKAAIGIVVLSALALLSEAGKYLLLMYFTVA